MSEIKAQYSVEVLGFSQTERIVLNSIFGLSARRSPKFVPFGPTAGPAPDLFLVDSNDNGAVAQFRQKVSSLNAPAVLIGDADHGFKFPVLPRPLQWARLFRAFDGAVGNTAALGQAPAAAPAAPAPAPVSAPAPAAAASAAPRPAPSSGVDKTQPLPATQRIPAPQAPLAPRVAQPAPAPARPAAQPAPAAQTPARPAVQSAPGAQAPTVPVAVVAAPVATDWVLVCDDNMTVREFMKAKLAPFGFNVDYAESGEQAVGLTGTKHYTCIFLDVVMPGIDGYQVCKLIKSKKAAAKTAVVMLTSKGSTFDKIRGSMSGCDAYLTKPVDEERLLEVIGKFLSTTA